MTSQTQPDISAAGGGSRGHDIAHARTMRIAAIIVAVTAFAGLVVAFGLAWKPYYQVPLGLAAYAAIEWQRHWSHRIKSLTDGDRP